MDSTKSQFTLFLPSCQETQGQTQPLATALSLDAAKNLCHQHFLKQCRTLQLRLPQEARSKVAPGVLDGITLQWVQAPAGYYEGQPQGCQNTPFVDMAGIKFQLRPAVRE